MKILYITSTPLEYNSSANMRNRALIRGLKELGNEISTLSADFNDDSIYIDNTTNNEDIKNRYWIKLGNLQSNITNNIKEKNDWKIKIKGKLYKIYTKLSIYDPRKSLVKKITSNIVDDRFDVIISSSDPKSSHLLAEKLIKLNPEITKRWIQYWGDPFTGDINKNTLIPENFIRNEEKRLINLCDKVVYVSPFTLKKQQEIYKEYKDKMIFVPIPYVKEKIYGNTVNKKITLGYFGDYNSRDRNIEPLYKVVSEDENLYLNICGNSDINLENKDNILIQKRQKMKVIEELEEKTNILVCICNRRGTQIPGKVYHYAATNKAILVITDGENKEEMKKYFESYDRYYICGNEKEDIKKAIEIIIKENKDFQPSDKLKAKNIANSMINL